ILAAGTTDRTVVLLDRASGDVLWRQRVGGTIRAGPLLDQDRLYVATQLTPEGKVYALRLKTGKPLWEVKLGSVAAPLAAAGDAVYGAPALARDTLYVLTRGGRLWLIPIASHGGARSFDLNVVAVAGPTPVHAGVLVGSVSGEVLLVSTADGQVQWRTQLDGPIDEPPLVRDRDLFVVAGRGDIHAYR